MRSIYIKPYQLLRLDSISITSKQVCAILASNQIKGKGEIASNIVNMQLCYLAIEVSDKLRFINIEDLFGQETKILEVLLILISNELNLNILQEIGNYNNSISIIFYQSKDAGQSYPSLLQYSSLQTTQIKDKKHQLDMRMDIRATQITNSKYLNRHSAFKVSSLQILFEKDINMKSGRVGYIGSIHENIKFDFSSFVRNKYSQPLIKYDSWIYFNQNQIKYFIQKSYLKIKTSKISENQIKPRQENINTKLEINKYLLFNHFNSWIIIKYSNLFQRSKFRIQTQSYRLVEGSQIENFNNSFQKINLNAQALILFNQEITNSTANDQRISTQNIFNLIRKASKSYQYRYQEKSQFQLKQYKSKNQDQICEVNQLNQSYSGIKKLQVKFSNSNIIKLQEIEHAYVYPRKLISETNHEIWQLKISKFISELMNKTKIR